MQIFPFIVMETRCISAVTTAPKNPQTPAVAETSSSFWPLQSVLHRSRRSRLLAIKHSKPQTPHSVPAMLIRLPMLHNAVARRRSAGLGVSAPNVSQINTDILYSWGKQVLASRRDLETRSGSHEFQLSQDTNKSSAAQNNNNKQTLHCSVQSFV